MNGNQKKLIILGCDHNLDLLKSSIHKQTDHFIDLNLDNNLFPCIRKPTRITKTSTTLIDNIFVSSCLYNSCSASVLVNDMSDHLPCKVVIKNMYPLKNKAVTKEIRKVTKKSTNRVLLELNKIDWTKEFIGGCDMTSINTNFKTFGDIIKITMNFHMLLRTINVNKIHPSRPWLYPSLCKCIIKSKKLFAKTLDKNSSDIDHQTYKNYCNVLNRVKQKAITTYFSEKCEEFKQNGKKLWGIIRTIVQKQNDKSSIIECL